MGNRVHRLVLYQKNRRLYSREWSRYTNAAELAEVLRSGTKLQVVQNGRKGADVTRQALFSILSDREYSGQRLLSQTELENILMRPQP